MRDYHNMSDSNHLHLNDGDYVKVSLHFFGLLSRKNRNYILPENIPLVYILCKLSSSGILEEEGFDHVLIRLNRGRLQEFFHLLLEEVVWCQINNQKYQNLHTINLKK